jgi:polyisoprenoid-binding protein YceI
MFTAVGRSGVVALLLAVGCWQAQAQEAYKIDAAQSEVHFTLTDVLHVVHGTFRVQQGDIVFNPAAGTMGGSVAVDARSGESGNNVRDRRMTEDELKAPTYSTVTFAPKRFKGTIPQSGDAKIEVDGLFTILGTAHEITVPMEVHFDGTHCKATGSFAVPYVNWGLKDPSTFVLRVAKEVSIDLVLVGDVMPASSADGSYSAALR